MLHMVILFHLFVLISAEESKLNKNISCKSAPDVAGLLKEKIPLRFGSFAFRVDKRGYEDPQSILADDHFRGYTTQVFFCVSKYTVRANK